MIVKCKITGNSTCFHLEAFLEKGTRWDTQETSSFASSLCQTLNNQIQRLGVELGNLLDSSDDQSYRRSLTSAKRNWTGERYGYVIIEIYAERRKGKLVPFCRISIDDSTADLRTKNILPEIARFVYKLVWYLKKAISSPEIRSIRQLNIIRDFEDPRSTTHELFLENGIVKERPRQKN